MKKKLQLNKETMAVLNMSEMSQVIGQGPDGQCMHIGQFFADVYDCTVFYQCDANLVPLQRQCPPGLEWSAADYMCDYPHIVQCGVKWPTTKGGNTCGTTKDRSCGVQVSQGSIAISICGVF